MSILNKIFDYTPILAISILIWGCAKTEEVEEFPDAYSGIGVELEIVGGSPVVKSVFEGGPAYEYGLQKGDVILDIDGKPVKGLSLGEVVMMLRGPTGSQVLVAVTGKDRPARLIIPINRGSLKKGSGTYVKKKGR